MRLDWREIFGPGWSQDLDHFRRYCTKSFGCKIVDEAGAIPASYPSPISTGSTRLPDVAISIHEPLLDMDRYEPWMGERLLWKGELYGTYSTSSSGDLVSATWWECYGKIRFDYQWDTVIPTLTGGPIGCDPRTYSLGNYSAP